MARRGSEEKRGQADVCGESGLGTSSSTWSYGHATNRSYDNHIEYVVELTFIHLARLS